MKPVLVIEDHPLVADVMRDVLMRSGCDLEPVLCPDAASALQEVSDPQKRWFRIFLDLDVPGAHGLSLARELHHRGLHSWCCVVSGYDRRDLIEEVQRMGFLGYITKASPSEAFAKALRAVLAGESSFPTLAHGTSQPLVRLTRRQEQLLDCVRRGMSSKEIARALYLSEGTVNNGVATVIKALDATSRSHALVKALELGLIGFDTSDTRLPAEPDRRSTRAS